MFINLGRNIRAMVIDLRRLERVKAKLGTGCDTKGHRWENRADKSKGFDVEG